MRRQAFWRGLLCWTRTARQDRAGRWQQGGKGSPAVVPPESLACPGAPATGASQAGALGPGPLQGSGGWPLWPGQHQAEPPSTPAGQSTKVCGVNPKEALMMAACTLLCAARPPKGSLLCHSLPSLVRSAKAISLVTYRHHTFLLLLTVERWVGDNNFHELTHLGR